MKRALTVALLCFGAQACAQEGESGLTTPLTQEERDALLDDEHKRAGRGPSPWKPRIRENDVAARRASTEPPAPPLIDDPCALFETTKRLVEVQLVNDYEPVPYRIMVPVEYVWGVSRPRQKGAKITGALLMDAWAHDFAPYETGRDVFGLKKTPNDHLTLLVRGGTGGPEDGLDVLARYVAVEDMTRSDEIVPLEVARRAGFDDATGFYRYVAKGGDVFAMPLNRRIGFGDEGSVTDLIWCSEGPYNSRCTHEMKIGSVRPKVTYDLALFPQASRFRTMTERFFGCARAAYEDQTTLGKRG